MAAARTIALVQFSGKLSGSTISSRFVARALRNSGARVVIQLGFPGSFEQQAKDEEFECSVVPHNNWLRSGKVYGFLRNYWQERQRAAEFRRRFAELKPDLVYVNTMASYAAAKAAHDLGIPVIWHLRELFRDANGELEAPPLLGKAWVGRTIQRLSQRTASPSSSVCPNVFGCDRLPSHRVIPNTVDLSEFESAPNQPAARAQFDLPADVPIIGLAGTFRPVKGQDLLVRSIPAIVKEVPTAIFAFAGGDSPFRQEVQALAAELGVADRCHFVGEVKGIARFYSAVDVLCMPSRSESFGRAAVEAFAAKRPVVAANVGGLRDIMRPGENGLVVEREDTAALAEAVVRLLRADEATNLMVANGQHDLQEWYSEAAHTRAIQSLVGEVLN